MSEEIGESPLDGPAPDGRVVPPGAATPPLGATIAFVLFVAGLFTLGTVPLQILLGEAGLLASQLLLLLVPSLLFVRLGGFDPVRTFSLRQPTRGQIVGGAVVLVGGVQIAWFLAWAQTLVMPVPVDYLEAMADQLRADSLLRFLWILLLAAVVPALVEEVLFRGVVLSGMRSALPTWWAVVLSGVVFGGFHLSPETAFRFLPAAWLGMLLAGVVVVTGSLPLAMLLHAANNGFILAVASIPMAPESLTAPEQDPPLALLPLALLTFGWGVRKLLRERKGRAD